MSKQQVGPKIGTIDIETAPIIANVWGLFDQRVGLNQIDREWAIISFSFKPLRASRRAVEYMDTSLKDDPYDDKELVARLWEIMHEYDILIAQNGKRFDMRKIRARMLMHGMPPPSPVKVIDTLLMAKQVAAFTSNRLEWLAQYLSTVPKSSHREFPGFELWAECLARNPKAWVAMRRYNVKDILSCEEVYLRLRPWVNDHPNIAVYLDNDTVVCPVCGSHKIERDGYAYTNTGKYPRYHCQEADCGAWSRGRYTINTLEKRKGLLSNVTG